MKNIDQKIAIGVFVVCVAVVPAVLFSTGNKKDERKAKETKSIKVITPEHEADVTLISVDGQDYILVLGSSSVAITPKLNGRAVINK